MKENIREDVLHFLPIVSSRNHTDGEIEEITQAMYDYHGLCVEDAGNDEAAGMDLFNETFMEHLKEIAE